MKTSTTMLVASLILSAGFAQAQSQQQSDQQNQQSQYSNSNQQQQAPASQPLQQQQPQSASPSSTSQDSSGQSGGSTSQGTSQDSSSSQGTSQGSYQSGSQENNSTQSQSDAQSSSDQSQSDTVQAELQPQTENGITYLCGGVGEEQASYMKQQKGDYDLMLTFASRNGEYLADVDVAIKDAKGKSVLNTTCGGPMLLVSLPRSGTYRIQAQAEDYSLRKTVKVKAKGQTNSVVMHWPIESDESVASTGSDQGAGSSGSSEGRSGSGQAPAKKHSKKLRKKPSQ